MYLLENLGFQSSNCIQLLCFLPEDRVNWCKLQGLQQMNQWKLRPRHLCQALRGLQPLQLLWLLFIGFIGYSNSPTQQQKLSVTFFFWWFYKHGSILLQTISFIYFSSNENVKIGVWHAYPPRLLSRIRTVRIIGRRVEEATGRRVGNSLYERCPNLKWIHFHDFHDLCEFQVFVSFLCFCLRLFWNGLGVGFVTTTDVFFPQVLVGTLIAASFAFEVQSTADLKPSAWQATGIPPK